MSSIGPVTSAETSGEPDAEIAALRARVAELEAQLVEAEDWANRTVAAAQERVYWLDRWHIDLNRLMERPGAAELRALLRGARAVLRGVRAVYSWLSRLARPPQTGA
jgi:hypothetical protein